MGCSQFLMQPCYAIKDGFFSQLFRKLSLLKETVKPKTLWY